MECVFQDRLEVGTGEPGSATLIVGKIVRFHVADEVYQDGHIVYEKVRPLSRLGGLFYGRPGEAIEKSRPQWKQQK